MTKKCQTVPSKSYGSRAKRVRPFSVEKGLTPFCITDPTLGHAAHRASQRRWLDRWMALLRRIGNIQAWIILSLFYVVILSPFGLIFWFAQDPLRLRRRGSTWKPFARPYDTMGEAREQS